MIIEKFCSRLPREISNPMYNEYYNRLIEIDYKLFSALHLTDVNQEI